MPISALAVRRITIDVKRAMELTESGIFWIPDETELTHGWAIICGQKDTPYHGAAFAFEVRFPDAYPFEPPTFTYLTNDGRNRFNPNLYKNGKVCLSLLNTWQGEQWSGVQSLSSVLQCIQTAVLVEEPLRNEPAYSQISIHADIPVYNRMIQHASVETAILRTLADIPAYLAPVYEAIRKHAIEARPAVVKKLRELAATYDGKTESIAFYHMDMRYKFAELADQYEKLSA
jgi:ubiquitin-protein ligase